MPFYSKNFHNLMIRMAVLVLALGTAAVLAAFGPDPQAVDPTLIPS